MATVLATDRPPYVETQHISPKKEFFFPFLKKITLVALTMLSMLAVLISESFFVQFLSFLAFSRFATYLGSCNAKDLPLQKDASQSLGTISIISAILTLISNNPLIQIPFLLLTFYSNYTLATFNAEVLPTTSNPSKRT